MAALHVPEDRISPSLAAASSIPEQSEEAKRTAAPKQDSLSASTSSPAGIELHTVSSTPQLARPEPVLYSLLDYFKIMSAAKKAFRDQLQRSEWVDQETRRHSSQMAAELAASLLQSYAELEAALANLEEATQELVDEVHNQVKEMERETAEQNERIEQLNAGNAEEKQQCSKLNQAYQDYLRGLKEIGAVDLGNGSYTIPEGAQDSYNALAQNYQQAVAQFNAYAARRQMEIKTYNDAAAAYNQSAAAHNASMAGLLAYSESGIPFQAAAGGRSPSDYASLPASPPVLHSTPATLSLPSLPAYLTSIASSGVSSISLAAKVHTLDDSALREAMSRYLHETQIAPLENQIASNYLLWSFANERESLASETEDSALDPLLNAKPLALKLLPEALFNPPERMEVNAPATVGALALQALGMGSRQMGALLGRALFKQVLKDCSLKLEEGEEGEKRHEAQREGAEHLHREEALERLADEWVLVSLSLLGDQSFHALFPALSFFSDSREYPPEESPAFTIALAASLFHRVVNEAQQPLVRGAVEPLIDRDPRLKALNEEQKSSLAAIIHLGHLLIAGKLLASSLGLPEWMAHTLPSLLPPSMEGHSLVLKTAGEERAKVEELKPRLEERLTNQGVGEEEAAFLALTALKLSERNSLPRDVVPVCDPETVDRPLLLQSLQAALILSGRPLREAGELSERAVDQTLSQPLPRSERQLRSALEKHLQETCSGDEGRRAAAQALWLPSTDLPPERYARSLLSPQLGDELAETLAQEATALLFDLPRSGGMEPSSSVSTPSWSDAVRDQIALLQAEHHPDRGRALEEILKESIKRWEDFATLASKILRPARQLRRAAQGNAASLEAHSRRGWELPA